MIHHRINRFLTINLVFIFFFIYWYIPARSYYLNFVFWPNLYFNSHLMIIRFFSLFIYFITLLHFLFHLGNYYYFILEIFNPIIILYIEKNINKFRKYLPIFLFKFNHFIF